MEAVWSHRPCEQARVERASGEVQALARDAGKAASSCHLLQLDLVEQRSAMDSRLAEQRKSLDEAAARLGGVSERVEAHVVRSNEARESLYAEVASLRQATSAQLGAHAGAEEARVPARQRSARRRVPQSERTRGVGFARGGTWARGPSRHGTACSSPRRPSRAHNHLSRSRGAPSDKWRRGSGGVRRRSSEVARTKPLSMKNHGTQV